MYMLLFITCAQGRIEDFSQGGQDILGTKKSKWEQKFRAQREILYVYFFYSYAYMSILCVYTC